MRRGIFFKIFLAMMFVSILGGAVIAAATPIKRTPIINSLLSFAGLILLVGVVSFYVASGITRSLRNLRKAAEEVGRGNLRYRANLHTGDEIEEVGNTFNSMTRSIERREKETDQLKSDFISIASHQLRTPLSVIKWLTRMILAEDLGPLNKDQKDYLERAYESNERMVSLVNDLLNVSRIEEGKLVFKKDDVHVIELVKEITAACEIAAKKNGLALAANFMPEDVVVKADKEKMYMALANIVDNAIKFTPRGGQVAITVKEDNGWVSVSVSDTGIGISLKDKPRLFKKFFRAENARLVHPEGSGLGLFIVKNIIERHGGAIEINSELQKGTTVVCKLPVQK